MKVHELIERLRQCDPDATVYLTEQPTWPCEHALAAVVTREEVRQESGERRYDDGRAPQDVLLLDGAWVRYGERAAWDLTRKRSR